jgi:VIT1/CCC1 family predicted Fe2+/Mn2+ transporter
MGFGTYLATKSQVEFNKRLLEQERNKIRNDRKTAVKELRSLYRKRGVKERDLKRHMDTVMDDEREWIEFVMDQKYGVGKAGFPNPAKGGAIMFFVFIFCGLIPIAPLFFMSGLKALAVSAFFTAIGLFFVGALKKRFTGRSWLSLGLENLLIGAVTGTVGFVAGIYTSSLMGGIVVG